jgi:integrase
MRRGEVLGLRWRDLDLVAGRLAVSQTLIAPDYQVQFSTPKTEKGRRSVPLDAATIAALHQHQAGQEQEAAVLGSGWASLDLGHSPEGGLRSAGSLDYCDYAGHLQSRHPDDAGDGSRAGGAVVAE